MLLFKKIVYLGLATLIVVASMGLTVNKHYCMGELRSVAIHTHAPNCFELVGQEGTTPMGCCEDTSDLYQVDDDREMPQQLTDLNAKWHLVATILYVVVDITGVAIAVAAPEYLNYKPPLIAQDVPVMVQSFLL